MAVEAKLNYTRMSPRKVRLVADLVRGKHVLEAENILEFTVRRPAEPVLKLLRSAIANAEHNHSLKKENLYISEIRVDGGPTIKRFRPRARGAAFPINKRTSHVFIKLEEKQGETLRSPDKTQDGAKEVKKKKDKGKAKIEKVYQTEKPKEEAPQKSTKAKPVEDETAKKESAKGVKGDKKQLFRRKSI